MGAVFTGRLGALRVLDRQAVKFFCPCSRDRAGASLAILGSADLSAMILDDGKAEVICNFCRARYDFDDKDLERIRRQGHRQRPSVELSRSSQPAASFCRVCRAASSSIECARATSSAVTPPAS